ncbi:MAG TPA: winged helix-turn-helix transcriptional regulator [Rectinema sp.]|nr:winged helix-turn-helix transcriptional regulator [Myxococcales bacterium]HQB07426.1 winged helix-turn-helix transcriptional regulator [Rectinema sp.]HQH80974.1 winged helix-turn-helix transcriptional regulator [bacterium]
MPFLSHNELTVLESLHDSDSGISQREIARRTGLSVGLINAVIKKLVKTGYVKTSHLNRRSLDYLLTPEGFAQTAMRSYRYVVRTVKSYRGIQIQMEGIFDKLSGEGISTYYLNGDGEVAELIEYFFARGKWGALRRGMPLKSESNCVILNASPEPMESDSHKVVNLIQILSDPSVRKKIIKMEENLE